ncbi:hypothetical protein [Geobacter sp. AOG1]|uniref:hypothetical protein n=1 Tax=Geobacter sp. AOG1 TaxID=1566346 RepID=UPI001CC7E386|nr:hypothetical protein [Geobacter sp. AOG1]GFE58209.1 hypothetical protein AOG1_20890 [Geobacter sp. AOG1]
MAKLPGNSQLISAEGIPLFRLVDINALPAAEKDRIYGGLIPPRLLELFSISPRTFCGPDGGRKVSVIAPAGFAFMRMEVRLHPDDRDTVFFLDIAETHYRQMDLAFCIINDPRTPRFDVDVDNAGRNNYFATHGRNLAEEERAMAAGLFPNQTRRGLRLFGEFFPLFERFVDSLGMEMIVAEPLTYDNAVRYEKYGFDYLTGRRLMEAIDRWFQPGGELTRRLDGSTPFRQPGQEKTVRGRSWAIHDGIMDEPWDDVRIYKMVGESAGIDTFPGRENEKEMS